jgi:hypothetical protein
MSSEGTEECGRDGWSRFSSRARLAALIVLDGEEKIRIDTGVEMTKGMKGWGYRGS